MKFELNSPEGLVRVVCPILITRSDRIVDGSDVPPPCRNQMRLIFIGPVTGVVIAAISAWVQMNWNLLHAPELKNKLLTPEFVGL